MDDESRGRREPNVGTAIGCLASFLFAAVAMSCAFIANVIGDCAPGVDCHRDLERNLAHAAAFFLPASLIFGLAWYAFTNAWLPALGRFIGSGWASFVTLLAAAALSIAAGWFAFAIYVDVVLGL